MFEPHHSHLHLPPSLRALGERVSVCNGYPQASGSHVGLHVCARIRPIRWGMGADAPRFGGFAQKWYVWVRIPHCILGDILGCTSTVAWSLFACIALLSQVPTPYALGIGLGIACDAVTRLWRPCCEGWFSALSMRPPSVPLLVLISPASSAQTSRQRDPALLGSVLGYLLSILVRVCAWLCFLCESGFSVALLLKTVAVDVSE